MLIRLMLTVGTFAVGYYLGREVGRHEPMRRDIEQGRAAGRFQEIADKPGEDDSYAGEHPSGDGNQQT